MDLNKFLKVFLTTSLMVTMFIPTAFADAVVGDKIVTFGANLSDKQKDSLMQEMGVEEKEVDMVSVSIDEEINYLGSYIPRGKIGSKSYSSGIITIEKSGTGLSIKTNNVNWVTEDMYRNALITAGITDATIYITAPFEVSGTAALTGVFKAYESSSNEKIDEDTKQVANEEIVRTAEIAEKVGSDLATDLMNRIKEEIANKKITSNEEMAALITQITNEMGIALTPAELDKLVGLFMKMQELDINWDEIQNSIDSAREKVSDFVNSEEGQGFIQNVKDVMIGIIDWITGLFSSSEEPTK